MDLPGEPWFPGAPKKLGGARYEATRETVEAKGDTEYCTGATIKDCGQEIEVMNYLDREILEENFSLWARENL